MNLKKLTYPIPKKGVALLSVLIILLTIGLIGATLAVSLLAVDVSEAEMNYWDQAFGVDPARANRIRVQTHNCNLF